MQAWGPLPSAVDEDLDGPEEQDFEEDEELVGEDSDDKAGDPYEEFDDLEEESDPRHHPRREEWDG